MTTRLTGLDITSVVEKPTPFLSSLVHRRIGSYVDLAIQDSVGVKPLGIAEMVKDPGSSQFKSTSKLRLSSPLPITGKSCVAICLLPQISLFGSSPSKEVASLLSSPLRHVYGVSNAFWSAV